MSAVSRLGFRMLTVNLFDDTFRHAFCSTGWKESRHIQYVRDQMEFDGITLFTDGYVNSPIVEQVKSKYKIGWLREPGCLHPENYLVADPSRFDFILTYYKPLLDSGSAGNWRHLGDSIFINPYHFTPYAGVWIPKKEWGLHPKTKLCSMLYGNKTATKGHRIRHEIAAAVRPLGIVDFYGYEGEPVDYSWQTKVKVLKDYAFTIVTETCWQENLFTEILLDCFAMGTIPIFWGCPNIHEFFNINGIAKFYTIDELLFQLENARLRRFSNWGVFNAIQDNLNRVAAYEITEDWLYENVLRGMV